MRHHATRSPHLRETTNTSWLHIPLLVLLLLFMLAFHFQIPKHVLHLNSAAHLIHVPFFLSLSYHPTQSKAWCNERFAKAQGVIILQQRKRYMNEVCQKRKWLAKCLISQTAWYNKSSNPIRQLKRANQSHTCMILITKSICLAYSKYPEDWTQDSYRMCDMHNAHARTHTHTHHMYMQVVCYLANKLPRVMGHAATAGVPKIAMQLCHSSSASQSTLCSSFIIWLLTQSLGVCVVPWHPCNSIHVLLQWSLTKTMSLRT